MGLFAAAQAIGVGVGPAVGGWLVSSLGWRSVFWTTVPFGLAGALAAWLLVPPSPAAPAKSRFDWWGMVLLGPGLTALLLVLSKGSSWGFPSWRTVVSILAASLLLAGFLRRERRTTAPLIQLSLLGRRDFAWGIVGIALSYGMLYGMFFLMSFVLIRGGHLSPIEAGLHLAILPVALGLAAPFSGFLSERVGPRWLQVLGMICCATGLLMMNGALGNLENLGRDRLVTLMALLLFGAGLGLFIPPNNSATLAAAPASESAVAGGLLNLFRVLGTSVGVAAASSTLSWRLAAAAGPAVSIASLPADILFLATAQSLFLLLGFALVAAMGSLVGQPGTRRNS